MGLIAFFKLSDISSCIAFIAAVSPTFGYLNEASLAFALLTFSYCFFSEGERLLPSIQPIISSDIFLSLSQVQLSRVNCSLFPFGDVISILSPALISLNVNKGNFLLNTSTASSSSPPINCALIDLRLA